MSELDTGVEEGDRRVRVSLRGELDLASVASFKLALGRVESGSPPLLVLDLSALEFIDSTGLHAVLMASERAKAAGRRLVVVPGSPAVQRVFRLTQVDRQLEFVDPGADPAVPRGDE